MTLSSSFARAVKVTVMPSKISASRAGNEVPSFLLKSAPPHICTLPGHQVTKDTFAAAERNRLLMYIDHVDSHIGGTNGAGKPRKLSEFNVVLPMSAPGHRCRWLNSSRRHELVVCIFTGMQLPFSPSIRCENNTSTRTEPNLVTRYVSSLRGSSFRKRHTHNRKRGRHGNRTQSFRPLAGVIMLAPRR